MKTRNLSPKLLVGNDRPVVAQQVKIQSQWSSFRGGTAYYLRKVTSRRL